MRDWFNAILSFIGTTSLTDEEWATVNALNVTTNVYNQASYDELAEVLESREDVSTLQKRLVGVFQAKGAEITALETAKTNIFLGAAL